MGRLLLFLSLLGSGAMACYLFPYNTVHIDIDPTILENHSEMLTAVKNFYAEYSCSFEKEVEHSFNKTDGSYLVKRKLCPIECLCQTTRKWDYTPNRYMSFQHNSQHFEKIGLKFDIVKITTDPCTFYKTNYWSYYPHYNPAIDYIITKSKRTPSTKPDVFFFEQPNLEKAEPFQAITDFWGMDKPDNFTSERPDKIAQMIKKLEGGNKNFQKLVLTNAEEADELEYQNWMMVTKIMFGVAVLYTLYTVARVLERYRNKLQNP